MAPLTSYTRAYSAHVSDNGRSQTLRAARCIEYWLHKRVNTCMNGWVNAWMGNGQYFWNKIGILMPLELALQSHAWLWKSPKYSQFFSWYRWRGELNFSTTDRRTLGGERAMQGSNSDFLETPGCTAPYPAVCWQTPPLPHAHLLWKPLLSNSNQCCTSSSPFSWRLRHCSDILF